MTHWRDPNRYYTTPDQSGPESNSNDGVLHIPESSRTGASLSEAVLCHIKDTCWEEVLPPCRGAVGVIFILSQHCEILNLTSSIVKRIFKIDHAWLKKWNENMTPIRKVIPKTIACRCKISNRQTHLINVLCRYITCNKMLNFTRKPQFVSTDGQILVAVREWVIKSSRDSLAPEMKRTKLNRENATETQRDFFSIIRPLKDRPVLHTHR